MKTNTPDDERFDEGFEDELRAASIAYEEALLRHERLIKAFGDFLSVGSEEKSARRTSSFESSKRRPSLDGHH
jgi:hypothetical protein